MSTPVNAIEPSTDPSVQTNPLSNHGAGRQPSTRYFLRDIEPKDCARVKQIIVDVLAEHGLVGPNYACGDPELDDLYTYYQGVNGKFYVVEDRETGEVVGGGGFGRLKGTTQEEAVCEFQKFYILSECRGHGMGRQLIERCMTEAVLSGYRVVYLETVKSMAPAIRLYTDYGFQIIDGPWGSTGHSGCEVFMVWDALPSLGTTAVVPGIIADQPAAS